MEFARLIIGSLLGLVGLAGLVIYVVGRSQPERHTAHIHFLVPRPRAAVWAALTDYAALPRWWPAVKSLRFETRPGGTVITWQTDQRGHTTGFRTAAEQAPVRLVREIIGDNLPFGGTWAYELAEVPGGTRVTITEDGWVRPPFFRGVMKLFLKPDRTMRDFAHHFTIHLTTP